MKRPSFQFYPGDWRSNSNLRRCSEAARGAWMDIMCVLHDSDEYGIVRWPLEELARAAGVPLKLARELAEKSVLKGGDNGMADFTHTVSHAGQEGQTHTLIKATEFACWFCSRFVRDEWVRNRRGGATRFESTKQPPKSSPNRAVGEQLGLESGIRLGDGPSTSSSTSSSIKTLGAKAPQQLDSEFLDELKKSPAYVGINIEVELGKMKAWCSVNGRTPSKRRFVNWLNRVEKPISTGQIQRQPGTPTLPEIRSYIEEKFPNDDRNGNWSASFYREISDPKKMNSGLVADWKIHLSTQLNRWRAES